MDKLTYALIVVWMVLAVVDIVGIFTTIHPVFNIMFGILNLVMIFSLTVLLWEEHKVRKAERKSKKEQ